MKPLTIRIKSLEQGLQDFKQAFLRAQRGWRGKPQTGVFFTSIRVARQILTPQRLAMLSAIKLHKPTSIYALAKLLHKDLKNVSQDLNLMEQIGLVKLGKPQGNRQQRKPHLLTDHILLELEI